MRNFSQLFFILITVIILSMSVHSQAQTNSNYWVYQVTETETAYEIVRENVLSNTVENVTTIPKTPAFTLRSILPIEELAAAEKWFTGTVSLPVGASIPDYFVSPPTSNLMQVVPSPRLYPFQAA